MNLNELAVEVSKREGLKESLSIAQIKEVIKCMMDIIKEQVLGGGDGMAFLAIEETKKRTLDKNVLKISTQKRLEAQKKRQKKK